MEISVRNMIWQYKKCRLKGQLVLGTDGLLVKNTLTLKKQEIALDKICRQSEREKKNSKMRIDEIFL